MSERLYSTGDVARRLGIQRYQLEYLVETQQIPEPAVRVAGKRVWNEAEVQEAAKFLERKERSAT